MSTIDPETLRSWLETGKPVTLLDVRSSADRATWTIPGSLQVDAYAALKARNPHALDGLTLPTDVPVVTICNVGHVSQIASEQLQARGIEARSLEGGMQAWSLAWNTADVPLPSSSTEVIQIRRVGKGCLSYLIGSRGEAAVIDAALPPEVYLEVAWQKAVVGLSRLYWIHIFTQITCHVRVSSQSKVERPCICLINSASGIASRPFAMVQSSRSAKLRSWSYRLLVTQWRACPIFWTGRLYSPVTPFSCRAWDARIYMLLRRKHAYMLSCFTTRYIITC
jgi:rhodanese-related sulfurtransferase